MDKLIIEGQIINHDNETYGQVEINTTTGLIERVGSNLGRPDIKTTGLIFPGFIDIHVHAREDASGQQNYKEDYITASNAAINGGIVHFADMPNKPIPPVDDRSYLALKKLSKKSLVDVTLYAGIGPGTSPLSFNAPYKVFMSKSVGNLFFNSNEKIEEAIGAYKEKNMSFHCEDPKILADTANAFTHEERRPKVAEIKAIEFAIELIKKYKLKGKIVHVSTADGLQDILNARRNGLEITAEVTPHHLYFDTSSNLQMNPPLRDPEDRLALINGIKEKQLDFIATDHAPHTKEEKNMGISGVPHLDTYGPFVTWLIKEHDVSLHSIARVCAYNPGNFVNEFKSENDGKGWGKIEEGFVGSLTIVDMNKPITIKAENLKTRCAWSPFEGVTFPGSVTHTIVRGKAYDVAS